jgi:hypothetical protein
VDAPFDGFWQVLFDDPDEEVAEFRDTTIAVRESSCWIYAGGQYMELWADKRNVPLEAWPPDQATAARLFRTHRALAGRATWHEGQDGFVVEHHPEMSVQPALEGRPYRMRLQIAGDTAFAEPLDDSLRGPAHWRRLSGRGSSSLAGAWWSEDTDGQRWLYTVTAGHYGVMRSDKGDAAPPSGGEPTDEEAANLVTSRSMNAGAHLLASRTFDHWPMFASTPSYGAGKHPTFYLRDLLQDEFVMAFDRSGEDVTRWFRRATAT